MFFCSKKVSIIRAGFRLSSLPATRTKLIPLSWAENSLIFGIKSISFSFPFLPFLVHKIDSCLKKSSKLSLKEKSSKFSSYYAKPMVFMGICGSVTEINSISGTAAFLKASMQLSQVKLLSVRRISTIS